jgi:hypothetical protein
MAQFEAGDRIKIGTALNYNTVAELDVIESAMKRLEITSSDLVFMTLKLLSDIDQIQENLDNQMGTDQGALNKAGPLAWSDYKFKPMISLLREKVEKLGRILDLVPDFTSLDNLSKQYGLSGSVVGRLGRN